MLAPEGRQLAPMGGARSSTGTQGRTLCRAIAQVLSATASQPHAPASLCTHC